MLCCGVSLAVRILAGIAEADVLAIRLLLAIWGPCRSNCSGSVLTGPSFTCFVQISCFMVMKQNIHDNAFSKFISSYNGMCNVSYLTLSPQRSNDMMFSTTRNLARLTKLVTCASVFYHTRNINVNIVSHDVALERNVPNRILQLLQHFYAPVECHVALEVRAQAETRRRSRTHHNRCRSFALESTQMCDQYACLLQKQSAGLLLLVRQAPKQVLSMSGKIA